MLTKLLSLFAGVFGIAFLVLHFLFIFQHINTDHYYSIYIIFWRSFILFFILSTFYPILTIIAAIFKRIHIGKSFVPILINILVFVGICATSLARG